MATTRTYEDLFAATAMSYDRRLDPQIQEYAVNLAIARMWNAYSWMGTEAALPPFWLVPYEQDYGRPFYAVPTDFGRIVEASVVNLQTTQPYRYDPLKVVSNLQLTSDVGFPTSIAIKPDTEGFRIFPAAELSLSSPNWMIDGVYKKRPPKVTRSGLGGNTLLWDDQYFDAMCEAYKWATTKLGGGKELAQRELIFRQTLEEALQQENLEQGDPQIYPAEALASNYGEGSRWFR